MFPQSGDYLKLSYVFFPIFICRYDDWLSANKYGVKC